MNFAPKKRGFIWCIFYYVTLKIFISQEDIFIIQNQEIIKKISFLNTNSFKRIFLAPNKPSFN